MFFPFKQLSDFTSLYHMWEPGRGRGRTLAQQAPGALSLTQCASSGPGRQGGPRGSTDTSRPAVAVGSSLAGEAAGSGSAQLPVPVALHSCGPDEARLPGVLGSDGEMAKESRDARWTPCGRQDCCHEAHSALRRAEEAVFQARTARLRSQRPPRDGARRHGPHLSCSTGCPAAS